MLKLPLIVAAIDKVATQRVVWPDIVSLVFIGVAAMATVIYATLTYGMLKEMREARKSQLLPKLKLGVSHIGPERSDMRIKNVGPGPAMDIALELWFGEDMATKRVWTLPLLVPGEAVEHFLPDLPGGRQPSNDQFAETWRTISLKATYSDLLGGKLDPPAETLDFANYWSKIKAANQILQVDDIEATRRAIEGIEYNVKTIARAIERLPTSWPRG